MTRFGGRLSGAVPRPAQWDPFGFGLIYTVDPATVGTHSAMPAADVCVFARVVGGGPVSKLGLEVGAASGNISVAVYRNSGVGRNAVPGTRLATSGALPCPSVGYVEVSLGTSIVVQPGDWFALSCDNLTATFRCNHGSGQVAALWAGRSMRQTFAHPAPAVPAAAIANIRGYLLVGVA